ncbi:MAG: molybdopterin molybdotransferase MoeA [Rhodanobacteraceae bacterium]
MSFDRATDFPTHLSVDEARARIVEVCAAHALARESVPIERALDRILAEDIVATHAIPPFANSAMDGFALRAADLPLDATKRFHLRGTMLAGASEALRVGVDECVRITTGAPLPIEADTVVIKERVRVEGEFVLVEPGEAAHANVRSAGEDYAAGEITLRAGERLSAARLGVLASCGRAHAQVSARPRVALIATGDELVPPGQALGFGQIHDSNRYSLAGFLQGIGIELVSSRHVRDDPGALREALQDAAQRSDIVISSGGVSAGEADYFPNLLAELGRVHFWKVRMKPGMPFLCGEIGNAVYFGLPGNPVSSVATLLALVAPGLAAMQNARLPRSSWRAQLGAPIRKKHDRTEFLRARLDSRADGTLVATALDRQGSGMQRGLADADALIVVPEQARELKVGDVVEVLRLSGLC